MLPRLEKIEATDAALADEFELLGKELRRRVYELDGLDAVRRRADGDMTHSFDSMAEGRIFDVLHRSGLNLVIMSEESPKIQFGTGRDFLAIVDPVDGSDMVARGYPLASIAISLIDLHYSTPVMSRIYEIFTGVHYSALKGVARRNGQIIRSSNITELHNAFIVAYAAPESRRRRGLSRSLYESDAALFLNYGGPLDIAKVGAGQCDGVVESVKGFAPRDFVSGWHIASCGGAVACGPDGLPLKIDITEQSRTRFIVAANERLLDEMAQTYFGTNPSPDARSGPRPEY